MIACVIKFYATGYYGYFRNQLLMSIARMNKEAGTHLPHLFFIDHALALVPWQWSCLQVLSDFPKSKKVLLTGVFLLLPSLLPSLVFSSTATLTPEGHSCCQKVTVEVTFVGIFCDWQYFYRMLLDFMLTSMESTS